MERDTERGGERGDREQRSGHASDTTQSPHPHAAAHHHSDVGCVPRCGVTVTPPAAKPASSSTRRPLASQLNLQPACTLRHPATAPPTAPPTVPLTVCHPPQQPTAPPITVTHRSTHRATHHRHSPCHLPPCPIQAVTESVRPTAEGVHWVRALCNTPAHRHPPTVCPPNNLNPSQLAAWISAKDNRLTLVQVRQRTSHSGPSPTPFPALCTTPCTPACALLGAQLFRRLTGAYNRAEALKEALGLCL